MISSESTFAACLINPQLRSMIGRYAQEVKWTSKPASTAVDFFCEQVDPGVMPDLAAVMDTVTEPDRRAAAVLPPSVIIPSVNDLWKIGRTGKKSWVYKNPAVENFQAVLFDLLAVQDSLTKPPLTEKNWYGLYCLFALARNFTLRDASNMIKVFISGNCGLPESGGDTHAVRTWDVEKGHNRKAVLKQC